MNNQFKILTLLLATAFNLTAMQKENSASVKYTYFQLLPEDLKRSYIPIFLRFSASIEFITTAKAKAIITEHIPANSAFKAAIFLFDPNYQDDDGKRY